MRPDKIAIEPSYIKENGVWILDLESIPIPIHFRPREKSVVYLPPETSAGNHRHQRTEIFVGFGEGLEIIWLDTNNQQKSELMNPEGILFVFKVPAYLPHTIRNNSKTQPACLLEFATIALRDVEPVKVI